jgi:isopenicillin N synthase-like dioxygenase
VDQLTFPAHKDAISLAILFTWVGGLQIPAPDATWLEHEVVTEESWRWVEPIPGTAIVNCGDALELLTNGTLKSGLHRVVRAPGAQAPYDKFSVLIGTRPRNDLTMVPLQSPLIPPVVAVSNAEETTPLTCAEWGAKKIKGLGTLLDQRAERNEVLISTQ